MMHTTGHAEPIPRPRDARVEAACRRTRDGNAQARNDVRGNRLVRGTGEATVRGMTDSLQVRTLVAFLNERDPTEAALNQYDCKG